MEFTSKAVGNAALTTGIIGTSLGALSGAGGLAGLFGIGPRNVPPPDPGDKPVTRYEMGLFKEIADKNDEIVLLKANKTILDKSDDGTYDIESVFQFLAESVRQYGPFPIEIPPIPFLSPTEKTLSLNDSDINEIRRRIERSN